MQAFAAFKPALVAALAITVTLTACSGSPSADNGGNSNNAPASSPASAVASGAPSPVSTTPIACSVEIGAAAAAALAEQCIRLSPATRPPCNVENSCAMIQGEIARSCAVADEDAAGEPDCRPEPRSGAAAKAAIERYYSALNARDYSTAWQIWGPDGAPKQTYDDFVKGFAQTRRATVIAGTPGAVEGAAGSIYISVPVTVDTQLTDGRTQRFSGRYMLRQRNIETSQGWHIASASLKPD